MAHDLAKNLTPVQTIAPADINADETGDTVDRNGYDSATVVINVGTITDGTHTPKVQHAADDGTGSPDTWEDVADADLIGDLAALSSDEVQWCGYKGDRRFVRAFVTVAGGPSGPNTYGATVELGHPTHAPTFTETE